MRIDTTAISTLQADLTSRKPVFCSEMDFQLHLAWEMKESGWEVSLEHDPLCFEFNAAIDIMIHAPERVAIELKYKTALLSCEIRGRIFALKNQCADDCGMHDFIKDVSRIERVVEAGLADKGFAIFLTNHNGYWQPQSRPAPTTFDQFRLHEGRVLEGTMCWSGTPSNGTVKGREKPLVLTNSYPLTWIDHVNLNVKKGRFRYLMIEVHQRE